MLSNASKLKTRNIGLDLMRILAMMGILVLHTVAIRAPAAKLQGWVAQFIVILAYGSVDLFGMLSGYLSATKQKFSTYRILELITTVLFYCAVITALAFAFDRDCVESKKEFIQFLKPQNIASYWYIICYFALFFLMPYINVMINHLSEKAHGKLCVIMVILFTVLPAIGGGMDFFGIKKGYCVAWLVVCYIIGAYFKRTEKMFLKHWEFPIYILCSLVILSANLIAYFRFGKETYNTVFPVVMNYTIFPVFVGSVMLLQLGRRMKTDSLNIHIKKAVMALSSVAFDVYIIHCHQYVFVNLIKNQFVWIFDYRTRYIPFLVAAIVIAIYLICFASAKIKELVFKIFRIEKLLKWLASKLDKALGWDKFNIV